MPVLSPFFATLPVLLLCFLAQRHGQTISSGGVLRGVGRAGFGAAKLVLLAPPLERLVAGAIQALPQAQSLSLAWMSTFAFTIQLYLVLSGVVDVWLGTRQARGKAVVEIFGAPFRAVNFGDSWRQWNLPLLHVLGGRGRTASSFQHAVLSLTAVLIAVVIWRGASWGTAAWAVLHLLLLAVEHWRGRSVFAPLPAPVCAALTQAVVLVSGVFLFMPGLGESWDHVRRLVIAPPPSWYSLLLDARLSTPLPMWCLWLSGLSCVALPPVRWVLAQAPRIFGVTGILSGLLAGTMLVRYLPEPAVRPLAVIRHGVQWPLTLGLREGNAEVFVGHEGWLCRQRDLDRLTLRDQGGSAAARLVALADALRGARVPLLVIAVPDKAALYPEYVLPRRYHAPVNPMFFPPALERLRKAKITVLDASDLLWQAQKRMPIYFRLDSHWTPEGMKEVALAAGQLIRTQWPQVIINQTPLINVSILERGDAGDLSRRLDPWAPESLWGEEMAELVSISGLESTLDAPVLVLGGSLIHVFDDPRLSFGNTEGQRQSASFMQQLAALLGRPLAHGPAVEEMGPEGLEQAVRSAQEKRLVIAVLRAGDL
ncbi:MAG TPA: hypothetical protein VD994_15275 [Prosthecobacter sp.]|nr:hypothetical protein [Prosthecobacter sp.]